MYNIIAIVASDPKGGIGKDNKLPWNYPEDLEWFKNQTMGNTCVASKSLYNRDLKKLKGRHWVAISSEPGELAIPEYNYKFHTPKSVAEDLETDIIIVGGPKVYEWAYNDLTHVILTEIENEFDCDAFINKDKLLKDMQLEDYFERGDYRFTLWSK